MSFIEELKWRGVLHDIMPGTEEVLNSKMTAGYIGFDPTADSLHVGSLAQIITLMRFQKAGHKPIALIGGSTGMVGDPSGKSAERNLLDIDTLNKNINGIHLQLSKFLNFDCGDNSAELVNNYDWMKNFSFLDFIRDIGKHLTVNYMSAKDSVKNRLEGENGMSFTEFSYQLLQGYDFLHLYKEKNCLLQMGGSDQWGNITTGTDLIGKKGGKAFALTTQLIKKSDGTKFGKTESGNIWLDKTKTTPYEFFQFWMNTTDADAESYIKIFTFLSKEEIEALIAKHNEKKADRLLQKTLAKELTIMVHSEADFLQSIETASFLFKCKSDDIKNLSTDDFNKVMGGLDTVLIEKLDGINIVDLLVEKTKLFKSKTELRKLITSNSISLNKVKVNDVNKVITKDDFINDGLLITKGKITNYLIKQQ